MTPLNDKALEAAASVLEIRRNTVIAKLQHAITVTGRDWRSGRRFFTARGEEDIMDDIAEAIEILQAGRAAVTAYLKADGDGWRSDMSKAPRDRNIKIDLWLMSRKTGRHLGRRTDCYWGNGWQRDGKFICGKWYVDDGGHDCLDPLCEDEESIVATHWRPLPEPPGGKGE